MIKMIVFQVSHLKKYYGAKLILDDVNLTIQEKEKIALVGANGAGKSTLLKIMADLLPADGGEIHKSSNLSWAYLAQDSQLDSQKTIWEEMLTAFSDIIELEAEIAQVEQGLQGSSDLAYYEKLSEKFRYLGGYDYKTVLSRVLNGLRFPSSTWEQPIHILSGGQKTRLALAKQLLLSPQLLILDEPTNYLDLETLIWLEQYLKSYPGALLIVSHDRYLLDHITSITYELENSHLQKYNGNYSRFLKLKKEQMEQQEKQYQQQKAEIARQQEFIQKNMVRASTTARASSRQKMLDKMELVAKPLKTKKAHFSFPALLDSGHEVLTITNLSIGYADKIVNEKISAQILKGSRVALVGSNGIGKTTLLKTLAGFLLPLNGRFKLGVQVSLGYYEQEQKFFHPDKTMLQEVWDDFPACTELEIRSLLAGFLLRGEDVYKTMRDLSGGEKARVALAKLSLQKANFLLLDEPTNHLDVYAREILEQALLNFAGTILLISHDRYFLQKMATEVWELTPNGVQVWEGNYDYYCSHRNLEEKPLPNNLASETKNAYQQQKEAQRLKEKRFKRIKYLEEIIQDSEKEIEQLHQEMEQAEVFTDLELLMQKNQRLEAVQAALEEAYTEWLELSDSES